MILGFTKKILLILSFTIVVVGCRPSKAKIVNYENSIINIVNQVVAAEDSLVNNLNKDSLIIQSIYQHLSQRIDSSIVAINTIKSIEKETFLHYTAIDLLNVYKKNVDNDYKELIQLVILPDEFYTQDKDKRFNFLLKTIDSRLNRELDKLFNEKQKFETHYLPTKK